MLHGAKVGLRARQQADVAVLHAELYEDIDARSRADTRPWRPISADSAASPFRVAEPSDGFDSFSVVELARNELAGDAVLWNIDPHNRSAHLGLALRPAFRGRRLGTDVVQVLCQYGFTVRGLHRLQLETLTNNTAMIRAATRNGFVQEGTLRSAAWVSGEFVDQIIFGYSPQSGCADPASPPAPENRRHTRLGRILRSSQQPLDTRWKTQPAIGIQPHRRQVKPASRSGVA